MVDWLRQDASRRPAGGTAAPLARARLPPPPALPWLARLQGWDVVALSDRFPGFSGSCGRCYEVRCKASLKDG